MTEANSTRLAYRDALVTAMGANERIVCLDTDTGLFAGVDFGPASDRYLNLGIAEQNALSLAAALALDGWRPHVITMAAFAESRAAEAVKIDVALNAAPVCIAATHAGLSSGTLGPTHHALSDLAVMRVLPNMTVLVPADADAAGALVGQLAALTGPVYLRLGRLATDPLPASAPPVIGESSSRFGPVMTSSSSPAGRIRSSRRSVPPASSPLPGSRLPSSMLIQSSRSMRRR